MEAFAELFTKSGGSLVQRELLSECEAEGLFCKISINRKAMVISTEAIRAVIRKSLLSFLQKAYGKSGVILE